MTEQEQRVAIAEACGFTGCVDAKCEYRKCQHLHKNSQVFFPETFSVPHYPNYPRDLNAMYEAEETLSLDRWCMYIDTLIEICGDAQHPYKGYKICHASAAHRAEAFLRTLLKWKD